MDNANMKTSALAIACLLVLGACAKKTDAPVAPGSVATQDIVDTEGNEPAQAAAPETPEEAAIRKAYSPYAGQGPAATPENFGKSEHPTHVFFGDTHNHTSNSGDAFMGGNRLTPEQAYRFARGEEVVSSTGVPVRLSRPMDFLVVADHAEGLGLMMQVLEGNPAFMSDPILARWQKAMIAGGAEAAETQNEVTSRQAQGTLPPPVKDPKVVGPIMTTVWKDYTATAEKFNEPGRFTAMIGYEWTSVPGGNNLHRNVLFRDGKDKADQVFPFSAWNSEDPEKLWDWMAQYEAKTGGKMLAIAHNAGLSNGRMFEPVTHAGVPLSKDYAERRARFDVLQEVMQTKGASETHPLQSPNDEFADFGVAGWEYGNLTLEDKPLSKEMMPTSYLRAGLQQGLKYESSLGVNPFKFGFIGGTDVHNSLSSIEENNFFGKMPIQEPGKNRWNHVSKKSSWDAKLGPERVRYTYHYTGAGYAAVWATENTREALWDAMKRKETYATSGSRMTVRLFGGWNFKADDAKSRDLASVGYAKGVPMGGDLPKADKGAKAPSFLVAAMKDPQSGNLDRIQIVKGWVDKDGKEHEQIYNVAWSDMKARKLGKDGRIPSVGDTVDIANASWEDTIGSSELTGVWTDPDFDASQRAFYYVRAIEIPTPRWTAYDAKRFGIKMPPEVPMKHQERAWTSPIWYTPN
jgi:hypothetical protein